MDIQSEIPVRANVWKNATSRTVEETFKKFPQLAPEVDDFRNLTSSSGPKILR